jgi:hypothetical protein
MRPHGRRALVDPENPRAFGVCDRCGQWVNHVDLQWQWDWRGNGLANLRLLVCEICLDVPQPQLKPRVIGPDPLPIINARPETFFIDETDERTTQGNTIDPDTGIPIPGGDTRVTSGTGDFSYDFNDPDFSQSIPPAKRVTQQTGEAPGGVNQTPGIDLAGNVPGSDDPGLPPGNKNPPETGPLT